jgi:hypothetical protein
VADASRIFFSAINTGSGQPGIFEVRPGTANSLRLVAADGLVEPISIAINADDTALFVADPASTLAGATTDRGAVLKVDTTTGIASVLIEGFQPTAITVGKLGAADALFFAGRDLTGVSGVFTAGLDGSAVTPIITGAPFTEVGAIAQNAAGDLKVVNHDGRGGTLYSVTQAGVATEVASGSYSAYPGSFAYSLDGLTRVLAKVNGAGAEEIVLGAGATAAPATVDVSDLHEITGIRRASLRDLYSAVDASAGGTGAVYLVQP